MCDMCYLRRRRELTFDVGSRDRSTEVHGCRPLVHAPKSATVTSIGKLAATSRRIGTAGPRAVHVVQKRGRARGSAVCGVVNSAGPTSTFCSFSIVRGGLLGAWAE